MCHFELMNYKCGSKFKKKIKKIFKKKDDQSIRQNLEITVLFLRDIEFKSDSEIKKHLK